MVIELDMFGCREKVRGKPVLDWGFSQDIIVDPTAIGLLKTNDPNICIFRLKELELSSSVSTMRRLLCVSKFILT